MLRELRTNLPAEGQAVLDEVKELLKELAPEGEKRLWQLYRLLPVNRRGRRSEEMTPLELLRHLIGRLAEDWASYREFDWQAEVPWTNNTTEQVIGKMKMRARTCGRVQDLAGYGKRIDGRWHWHSLFSSNRSSEEAAFSQFPVFTNHLWDKHLSKI